MRNVIRRVWKLGLTALLLSVGSCGHLKQLELGKKGDEEEQKQSKEEEAAEKEGTVRVVGEVVSLHPDEGFVLIRCFGSGSLPENEALFSVDHGGQSCTLKPTGERIGRFHAADISGPVPKVGDLVIARKLPDSGLLVSPERPEGAL